MLREIDIPPLWLALALLASWGLGQVWAGPGFGLLGVLVMATGLGLVLVSVWTMARARTTFVPRRDPSGLVTRGVFGFSRNPIYLGDALMLGGAILYWGAWAALPLVPLFMLFITHRYIHDEEARLRQGFGAQYESYAARVPRWLWLV